MGIRIDRTIKRKIIGITFAQSLRLPPEITRQKEQLLRPTLTHRLLKQVQTMINQNID